MNPPRTITIASQKITVEREKVKHKFGDFDPRRQRIRLDPRNAADAQADTLLHETIHAAWSFTPLASSNLTKEDEEMVVRCLTPFLLDMLRRNPRLVAYLTNPGGTP